MSYLKYFFVGVFAILSLSLITAEASRGVGNNISDPLAEMNNLEGISGANIDLLNLKGQKVLVFYWATYNANSRRDNILFSKLTKRYGTDIKMVSISLDRSKSVFERTIVADGVDVGNQFFMAMDLQNVKKNYLSNGNFKNYLIDETGTIVKENMSLNDLNSYLSLN